MLSTSGAMLNSVGCCSTYSITDRPGETHSRISLLVSQNLLFLHSYFFLITILLPTFRPQLAIKICFSETKIFISTSYVICTSFTCISPPRGVGRRRGLPLRYSQKLIHVPILTAPALMLLCRVSVPRFVVIPSIKLILY